MARKKFIKIFGGNLKCAQSVKSRKQAFRQKRGKRFLKLLKSQLSIFNSQAGAQMPIGYKMAKEKSKMQCRVFEVVEDQGAENVAHHNLTLWGLLSLTEFSEEQVNQIADLPTGKQIEIENMAITRVR
jgi:hypothetical protein